MNLWSMTKEEILLVQSMLRSNILWVTFHEVPEDVDALDIPVVEGIVVAVFSMALNHLNTRLRLEWDNCYFTCLP